MLPLRFCLAQLNFTVGDIQNNTQKIINASLQAKKDKNADVIIFPELALSGYPPEDLLFRKDFLSKIKNALEEIKNNLPQDICAIIGYPEQEGNFLYNSVVALNNGKVLANHRKNLLPNYGVFDEKRYFKSGTDTTVFKYKNHTLGLTICEDLWHEGPAQETQKKGAQVLISMNASPFHQGKVEGRIHLMQKRVKETGLPLIYVNHCTGQDDLIFDGSSFILDEKGQCIFQAPFAKDGLFMSDEPTYITPENSIAQIYDALVLGVKDYVRKNQFEKVLLGFSGGVDSALTLAIAVDALGGKNVLPVILPSRYTSALSIELAQKQLNLMNLPAQEISIEPAFKAFLDSLALKEENTLTVQNLQARTRAILLMALSNQKNALLLNTSNKSEVSVGYSTLYGDLCGAYAVLKDVWKMEVYTLAHYRNTLSSVIPAEIIQRPPTAELIHGQQDTDTLPPYEILDEILKYYIEEEKSIQEIIKSGFDDALVNKVIKMVKLSEYKRKQSPPGPRISKLAFTRERRYPITTSFL